jgi:hypothetical protein
MRNLVKTFLMAAVLGIPAAFFMPATTGHAQVGFSAYMGGTVPTGDFGETVVERGKSGAQNGHSFGGAAAWRWHCREIGGSRGSFNPAVIITLGYPESAFGDDVPSSIVHDTLYATPESRIRVRGYRLGFRIIPWSAADFSPSVGWGAELQKFRWDSRAFYGPGPEGIVQFEPVGQCFTHESDNVLGGFMHAGFTTRLESSAIFFVDVVRHFLWAKDKSVTTEFRSPEGTGVYENIIKYDYQWWEIRAGLLFFLGS